MPPKAINNLKKPIYKMKEKHQENNKAKNIKQDYKIEMKQLL